MPKTIRKNKRPTDISLLRASRDLIKGNCDGSDQLNFFVAVSYHIARNTASASGEDPKVLALQIFRALDSEKPATAGTGRRKKRASKSPATAGKMAGKKMRVKEKYARY